MSGSEAFLKEPVLFGQEDLLGIVGRARAQSFLVTSPPGGGARDAGSLLARFWMGAGPRDRPADLQVYGDLRMADVRRAIEEAWVRPLEGERKALVLELPARPSREVLNALLRLAEEPPPHLGVFVVTTDPRRIPVTLRSRLIPLRLHPLPGDAVREWLLREKLSPPERAERVALLSGGWMARALELAGEDPPSHLDAIRREVARSPFGFLEVKEDPGKDRRTWIGELALEVRGLQRASWDPRYLWASAAVDKALRDLDANLNGALVVENLVLDLEEALGTSEGGDGRWVKAGGGPQHGSISPTSSSAGTGASTRGRRGTSPGGSSAT